MMDVAFIIGSSLPETYKPGGIYFIKNTGAIYVATSETEIVQYSATEISVAETEDIDNLFI